MKYHHLTQLNVTDPMPMALGPAVRPEAPAPTPCPVAAFERGDHGSAKGLQAGLLSVAEVRERFGFAPEPGARRFLVRQIAEPADPLAEFTRGILHRMAEALGISPDLLAETERKPGFKVGDAVTVVGIKGAGRVSRVISEGQFLVAWPNGGTAVVYTRYLRHYTPDL
jgi:hypothetical protein